MDQPIILHEETVALTKTKAVALALVIPGAVELDHMKNYIAKLSLADEDELHFDGSYGSADEAPTDSDLALDKERLHFWIESERAPWDKIWAKIPRKKNGTFAIGRIITLHRVASSETGYSEDAYGYYGDDLKVRTISDTTAVLLIDNSIRKYDYGRQSIDPATL